MSLLAELMSKKAEEMSDEDIDTICIHLREQRAQFNIDEAAGKRPTSKAKAKPSAGASDSKPLSLADLGLI